MKPLPEILAEETVCESQLFRIERQHLRFSNGAERFYERIKPRGQGAVLIVPMINDDEFYLVREYAAGLARYELSLPKGLINADEDPLETAVRELKEEIGFGAENVQPLIKLSGSPGYFCNQMHVVVARDLYPELHPGDEPEPLEVFTGRLSELDTLLLREDFSHSSSIAALLLMAKISGF